MLQPTPFSRSPRPFSFQDFVARSQLGLVPMADVEKKARVSGEQGRAVEAASILPTVEVAAEKSPPKPALHPAFYVVFVLAAEPGPPGD